MKILILKILLRTGSVMVFAIYFCNLSHNEFGAYCIGCFHTKKNYKWRFKIILYFFSGGVRWPFLAVFGLLLLFLPTSWTYFIWTRYFSNSEVEPSNKIIYFLCKCSQHITSNFILRFSIYTFIFLLTCISATVELVSKTKLRFVYVV